MLGRLSRAALAAALLLAGTAWAGTPHRLGDVPGTDGQWQQGSAVVPAPLGAVRGWMTDFGAWPRLFPDVKSATVLQHEGDSYTVRFRSTIIGRDMTLRLKTGPELIVYTGSGKDVTSQGKIMFKPIDGNHTEVLLQTSAEVHGMAGAFASKGMKRKKALRKIDSDLSALQRLAGRDATHL